MLLMLEKQGSVTYSCEYNDIMSSYMCSFDKNVAFEWKLHACMCYLA